MRLLLAALFLAQLFFSSAFIAHPIIPKGNVIHCDDAKAHEAAAVAVNYINNLHKTGYKFTLNQIENIRQLPLDDQTEILYLELDLLETKCPSVSPTPLANCSVRPLIERAVEGDCDVKLSKTNGTYTVLSTRCKSELDSAEKFLRIFPDYPLLAPLNDSQVIHAVDVSLHKFNSGKNAVFYRLHEIGRGKIQGNTVGVEFIIVASNCSIEDAIAGVACEVVTDASAHYGACTGTVVKHHDALDENVTVQCTLYEPQVVAQADVQHVPQAPPKPNVPHSHFHHSLYLSSESESAEHHFLVTPKKQAVKRSLTGAPVPPSGPVHVQICPGKKIHF